MGARDAHLKQRIRLMPSVKSAAILLLFTLTLVALLACAEDAPQSDGLSVEGTSAADVPSARDGMNGSSGASSGKSSKNSGDSEHDDNDNSNDDDNDDGESTEDSGNEDGSDEDENTDTVSRENPNPSGVGPKLNRAANEALANAEPLNIITWATPPTIAPGELRGEGTAEGSAYLFNPQFEEADGAAFEVYYEGHEEPTVVLLPILGQETWNAFETVAEMDWEMEGGKFSFRAYSPLFMDADPSALELRVYGYDGDGNAALLAVTPLTGE